MRRVIYIISILLFICEFCLSQNRFIVAGSHDPTDYFHDMIPDTTLTLGKSYNMDVNNDAIIDLNVTSSKAAGMFAGDDGVYLTILNGEVRKDKYYVHIFNLNDTIGNDTAWHGNSIMKISYNTWQKCPPLCPGYNISVNDTLHDKYLGYRLFTQMDTLYGWVKISTNGATNLTMKEWAINKAITGINEVNDSASILVSPNPANDKIHIMQTNNNAMEINLFDIVGKQVVPSVKSKNQKMEIDVSDMNNGVYFLNIRTELGTVTKKIIVRR